MAAAAKTIAPGEFLTPKAAPRALRPAEFMAPVRSQAAPAPAPPAPLPDAAAPATGQVDDDGMASTIVGTAQELWGQGFEKPLGDLLAGYRAGASRMYTTGANAAMLVNRVSQKLAELSGYEGPADAGDSYAEQVEAWLRQAAKDVAPKPTDVSSDLGGMVYQGLGAAPVAITEYLLGGRAVGTVPGMAGIEALARAHEGPQETAKGAVIGGLLGGALKGTAPLARLPRALGMGAVGGAQAAADGGGPKEIVAGAATMAAMGGALPGGRTSARVAAQDFLKSVSPEPRQTRQEPYFAEPPAVLPPRVVEPDRPPAPPADTAPAASAPAGSPQTASPASPLVDSGKPPEAPQRAPVSQDGASEVVTPRGRRVGVAYELVDADRLVTSHDLDFRPTPGFPTALQPRERTRAASQEQVNRIASNLTPELLGRSPSASEGAPIIGPDGVVESGNGRVLALRKVYRDSPETAARYRDWLASQGYDTAGLKAPVLVRRRTSELTPQDREAFVREANERTTLDMGASELAASDARSMPDWLIDLYRGGDIANAGNREFVRRFLDSLPENDRARLVGERGELSQDGVRRLENALFHRAYEDGGLLATLRESRDNNIAAIGNALTDVAADWARMRQQARTGSMPVDLDPTRHLLYAVRLVRKARSENQKVGDLARQDELFGSALSPEATGFLKLMFADDAFRKPVSRQRIAEALRFYADQAGRVKAGPSLLGDAPATSVRDILDLTAQRQKGGLLPPMEDAADMRAARSPGTTAPKTMSVDQMNADMRAAGPGNNYVGMRRETPATGSRDIDTPIRREDILKPLADALGLPFYQGRINKRSKMLGFFRIRAEEIRLKNANDLEVAIHEAAHLLDKRFPEIKKQWNPATKANEPIRKELAGVSYDSTKLYEGFAEFVRLWATQPEQAIARAPKFSDWWANFIQTNPYREPLLRFRDGANAWFEQDALLRARSKIGLTQTIDQIDSSLWSRFRQSILDDLHGIERMERELTGGIAPVGAYETARLTRAKASFIEGALTIGAPVIRPDGSHGFEGKGLKQILEPVADDLDRFWLYAVGRSARELLSQGRERLFTKAEIDAMTGLETPAFKEAFEGYQRWNRAVLDFAEAKGIIDPEVRTRWKRTQYLPFYRVGEAGASTGSKGAQGDWRGIKELHGGTANLGSPGENVIRNAAMLLDVALTNEARLKVARLAKGEGGARFMAEIPKEDRRVRVLTDSVKQAAEIAFGRAQAKDAEAAQRLGNEGPNDIAARQNAEAELFGDALDEVFSRLPAFLQAIQPNQAPGGRNVVAVLDGGRPRYFEVADPLMFRALTSLDRPMAHAVVRWLAVPRRLGQAGITLTADFMAANLARDTVLASILSRNGFRPFVDSGRGFTSRLLTDPSYKEFIANGGGFSSHLMDERAFRLNLERYYGRKGIDYRTVLDTPVKLLAGVERVADAFEMSTRLGEYRRAVERGQNPRHAAYEAREISTDFAMRGDSQVMGFMYDTVLFLKAAVNGLDRLYRGVTQDSNRATVAAKAGLLALMSMGLYGINRGNPLYEQLEDWDRDTHWHLFAPTARYFEFVARNGREPANGEEAEGMFVHLRYPKLWEIGAVASIAERTLQGILDGAPAEQVPKIIGTVGRTLGYEYVPQAVAPLYEIAINRNRFLDRPIETQSMQQIEPWARSSPYGSTTLRQAGEAVRNVPGLNQISPAQVESLLRGYFGTWAMYGLSLADAVTSDAKPDLRLDQYPVLRRFYSADPARTTRFTTELYDMLAEATQARRTITYLDRTFRPEMATEREGRKANLAYGQLARAEQEMQAMAAEIRQIYQARTLAEVQALARQRRISRGAISNTGNLSRAGNWNDIGRLKRALIDDIVRERNRYARDVVEDVRPPPTRAATPLR